VRSEDNGKQALTELREAMNVVIKFTEAEELKALPILLRHSPGTVLAYRTYILREESVETLRAAGIEFAEVSREPGPIRLEGGGGR